MGRRPFHFGVKYDEGVLLTDFMKLHRVKHQSVMLNKIKYLLQI